MAGKKSKSKKRKKKTSKKDKIIDRLFKAYTKKELIELTNSKKRARVSTIKKKLKKMTINELESMLQGPEPGLSFENKLIPIIGLSVFIIISILTRGFTYWPAAQAPVNNDVQGNVQDAIEFIDSEVTYLFNNSCSECYDVSINSLILANYGLNLSESYVDAETVEGQQLLNDYNITKYPTFILSSVASESDGLMSVWAQVGSVESDGSLVFRTPEIFKEYYLKKNAQGDFELIDAGFVNVTIGDDPSVGNESAPVTMVLFSEFKCPYSARFNGWYTDPDTGAWSYNESLDSFRQIKENFIDEGVVRFVFKDFPLAMHLMAHNASEAAECAHEQGMFWEFHDQLFENQTQISESLFNEAALEIGLNITQFNECYESGRYYEEVDEDLFDGLEYGVGGTPSFFINGRSIVGALPYEQFEAAINNALAELN